MSITIDLYRNAGLGNRLDGAFPLGDGTSGGGSITPLGGLDFNGLSDAQDISSLFTAYGTFGNGYGTQGDTDIKLTGKTSSALMSIQSGTTGRPGDGTPAGNGDFGFIYSLADEGHAVAHGEELWVYGKLYFPANFDFSGDGGLGLKFLRFTFAPSGSKLDVYIGEDGAGNCDSFSISHEAYPQLQEKVKRTTNRLFNMGQWNDFCFYVAVNDDTADTEMRLWINDEFMMEHVGAGTDITTKWIDGSGVLQTDTWTPSGGGFASAPTGLDLSSMYLFTYWNGNAAQDQAVNCQHMQYVKSNVGLSTDVYGNKYVNSTQVS